MAMSPLPAPSSSNVFPFSGSLLTAFSNSLVLKKKPG
jgi:hypothetical protein